jgi:hypothetical protein
VTNTADVTNSVDPFFFRITVQGDSSDFYVRDWTASASSGDNGVEPSTHGNFYSTSDVWNRRGTLDGTPFPADQPASEDAGNGAATVGDNWMFARIRRNAPAMSGSATVSAHFLVAKFGTGSSYIDSSDVDPNVTIDGPDPAVMFNAPDLGPLITSAVHWHLDEPAPSHLCIAVEIQSPGDPITGGTLRGHTPGWPGTDLRVLDDNNKAQRNIWHFSNMPARGPGMSDVVYAIAHNGATFQRTMELSYESGGAQIAVAGGKGRVSDSLLYLPEMEPGENRWIEVRVPAGSRRPVRFYEMKGAAAVNGFEVEPAPASFDQVVRERLAYHRSVFTRLAAETHSAAAAEQARLAQKLLEGRDPGAEYVSFVRTSVDALKPLISRWSGSRQYQGDAFGLAAALEALSAAFGSDDRAALPSAHFNLLTRLDSDITDVQLSRGDPADVLQTVTMQRDLFTSVRRLKALAPMVKERSERFIRAYEERKIGNGQYRELLAGLRATFAEAASGNTAATTALAEIDRNMNNVAGLQKSHRAFLLALR